LSRLEKSIFSEFYREAIDELVRARLAKNWSQYDLAAQWDRNQSVIAKIETRERRLDVIEFIDLCVILDLAPTEIIDRLHDRIKLKRF